MEKRERKPNENIQVFVRLRPANAREKAIRSMDMVEVPNSKEVVLRTNADAKLNKKFTFDRAFGPESKQNEVYAAVVAPLIEEVLSGYNCTVFAYGQTGTGKTHTMVGEEVPHLNNGWEDDNAVGVIPRAVNHLFDELRMMEMEFSMRVSYLELYNEELFDLLSPEETTKIRIFEDKKGGIIVHGLEEIPVHSKNDVYKLLAKGQEKRRTAPTLMNAQSSRSHTIFSIVVHMKDQKAEGEEMLKIGKLNLVDLAGSENISKAGNEKGVRARETVNINQSLLTLGRVMTALVEHQPHVPYRESKLTRLLQESLGGRTKTSIIATISPGHKDQEETANTLDYAHRAKNIQNRPEVNQRLTKKTVIKEFTEEIDRLKRDLMAARNKDGVFLTEESYNELLTGQESTTQELNEKVMQIRAIKEQLAEKEKLFTEVSLHLVEKTEELKTTQHNLRVTGTELMHTQTKLHTTDEKYRQQRFILKHHEHTERKLQSQAKDLLQVADIATSDVSGLQEMVDRRRDVDAQNQMKVSQFPQRIETSFKGFSGTAEEFKMGICRETEMIQKEMDASLESLKKYSLKFNDDLSGVYRSIDSLRKADWQMLDDLRKDNNITAENILKTIEESFVKKEEQFAAEMKQRFESITEGVNKQKENMDHIQGIATRLNVTVACVLESGMRDFKAISEEKKEKSKAIGEDIERMREMLNAMQEKWQQMDSLDERQEKTHSSTCETLKASLQESKMEICGATEEGHKLTGDQLEQLTGIESEMRKRPQHMETDKKQMEKFIEESQEKSQKTVESYGQDQEENLRQINLIISSIREVAQDEVEENTKSNEKMSQNISTVNEKTDAFLDTFEDFASNCVQSVRTFCTNELETYRPTGETPAKKNFQYSKALSQTSPHGRILQRFRYDPNNSFNSSSDILPGLDDDEVSPTEPNIEEEEGEEEEEEFVKAEEEVLTEKGANKEEAISKRDCENAENENPNVQRKKRSTGSANKALNRPLLGVQQESVYVVSSDDVSGGSSSSIGTCSSSNSSRRFQRVSARMLGNRKRSLETLDASARGKSPMRTKSSKIERTSSSLLQRTKSPMGIKSPMTGRRS